MRLVSIDDIKKSEKIGYTISLGDGRILLRTGATLTERYIDQLKKIGILSVYIDDEAYKDIVIIPAILEQTKKEAISIMAEVFSSLTKKKSIDINKVNKVADTIADEVKGNYIEPINIINSYAKDEPRYLHAVNVATIVAAICVELSLSLEKMRKYTQAAMLHDVMLKSMKDDRIFDHADEACSLIRSEMGTPFCYMAVKMHHEKYDGTGGPNKIKGEKINEGSRIIAVADMYDNLVYGHISGTQMLQHKAFEYVNMQSGKELDPSIVAAFNRAVSIYPTGATVVLNNGETGVVVGQNHSLPSRPKVKVITELKDHQTVNLVEHRTLFIDKVLL